MDKKCGRKLKKLRKNYFGGNEGRKRWWISYLVNKIKKKKIQSY